MITTNVEILVLKGNVTMTNYTEKAYLLLDVGGTQIKGAVFDEKGNRKTDISSYPSKSRESADVILDNFAFILRELMNTNPQAEIIGVGMAFPGPFDYEKGICQIQGLNKYDSIYGRALEPEMKKRIPEIANAKFGYLHDIEAFAVGEAWFGEMQNESKIVCLCIGTGTGTAFLKDRVPQKSGEGVPECGWLYWLPYRDSIIDDYISVRGLERICKEVFGEPKSGKELYDLCQKNDEAALEAWKKFGDEIIAAILPVIEDFHPNAIIFGGQISKSFSYFGKDFAKECEKRNIKIHVQTETSEKAMQGLFVKMTRG